MRSRRASASSSDNSSYEAKRSGNVLPVVTVVVLFAVGLLCMSPLVRRSHEDNTLGLAPNSIHFENLAGRREHSNNKHLMQQVTPNPDPARHLASVSDFSRAQGNMSQNTMTPAPSAHEHSQGGHHRRRAFKSRRHRPVCPAGDRTGIFSEKHPQDNYFQELTTNLKYAIYTPIVLSRNPWIVQFDTLYSKEECEALIRDCDWWAKDITAGAGGQATATQYRNSSSFSCSITDVCSQRPGIRAHRDRLASVLGIGIEHAEDLNVLKYEAGGYYRRHHDYILADRNPDHEICGPRMLTFMAYLTDVEDGGGTSFFHLGIVAKPKAGRALLWVDTLANRPLEKDERTAHEALTVVRGTKIVATTWLHQYDQATNQRLRCCHQWTSSGK